MKEWILLSWLFHQLILDYLICTSFRPWFLPDYLASVDIFGIRNTARKMKFTTNAFFHYLWISKIHNILSQLGFQYLETAWPMTCRKLSSESSFSLPTAPRPPICPWFSHTNHQVSLNLFTDNWYFIFPILQRQAGFTVLLAPVLEECIVQLSVGHHEGAKAITGKILEDMCVHWVGLGWVRAESRDNRLAPQAPSARKRLYCLTSQGYYLA